MAFKGITFAGQNVTPKNDGGLYQAHYGDGILWGCSMNLSGDDLVIQSGEFIMGGRYVQVDGATNVDLSGRTLQTGYIQVIMNADLTQGEGNQWYTTFVESATTTFPALTQDDINDNGSLYQLQLAVVQISGGNLTNITTPFQSSGIVSQGVSFFGDSAIFTDGNGDGSARIDNISGGNNVKFTRVDPVLGSSLTGIMCTDTYTTVYANGQPIYLRPNGFNTSAGTVYFDQNGQQFGGHQIVTKDSSSTVSLTGGWSTVLSQSLTTGLWDITGVIGVKGLGASDNIATINIGTSNGYAYARNTSTLRTSTSNTVYITSSYKVNLTATTTMNIYANASSTASCTEAHFRAIQIG